MSGIGPTNPFPQPPANGDPGPSVNVGKEGSSFRSQHPGVWEKAHGLQTSGIVFSGTMEPVMDTGISLAGASPTLPRMIGEPVDEELTRSLQEVGQNGNLLQVERQNYRESLEEAILPWLTQPPVDPVAVEEAVQSLEAQGFSAEQLRLLLLQGADLREFVEAIHETNRDPDVQQLYQQIVEGLDVIARNYGG